MRESAKSETSSPDSLARQRDLEAVNLIAKRVMEEFDVQPGSPYFAYHTFLRAIKAAASQGIVMGREIDSSEKESPSSSLVPVSEPEIDPITAGSNDAPPYY